MELNMNNSLLAGDPRLIDHIVGEVKSQGIFDQFRKECLADVDTKPAYQNLRTRVEGSVNSFLNKQTWRTDLNKNQLRETLRKHIQNAPYLEVGVERIVDQVVNPKIYSVFMPQIEDVVYKFLGIERPKAQRNGTCDLKDLLPKDLDPVSPESDRNSLKDISLESVDDNVDEIVNGDEQKPSSSNLEEKMQNVEDTSIKKEDDNTENGEIAASSSQIITSSPVKNVLNSSFKSDETKTEEEEEDSPVFEPIDMNLNESNMSNDSHLSGISELTSHRSQSPDFMTEFSRDNFDCSNQDSQLSKVSSNSRLSIVTDFGSSNQASTPLPESKEDLKSAKDNFKAIRELNCYKDSKFNFEVIKSKDSSKASNSSRENSRDASEYKESKNKEESNSKFKTSKDKYDSRRSRDKDRDSRKRRSSKSDKYSRSKSKDKNESESQDSKDGTIKSKEYKIKETEKKDDSSKEIKDLKDLYKEKIRELREKKELTEKEKLSKDVKDISKINKDSKEKKDSSSSREKDDSKKSHKSSSSSRSSSYHSKSSRSSESKDSKDKSSGKRDERRHSNGKSESKSSDKNKKDSKTETKSGSRNSDRSVKDKKRRDEKKTKSIDDHSSLRKNSNDRRSTDRDGSNGSSSKYSHKSSYSTSSGKPDPSTNLAKDNNKDHSSSSGETSDNVQDNLQIMFGNNEYAKSSSTYSSPDNPPKRVDPGSAEICLPLKKRPLHSEESTSDDQIKKLKVEDKKAKIKDIFKIDTDVASVPDEERVQIIEIPDEDYDQPYQPHKKPILSLEETKKIILDAELIPEPEPVQPIESKLSEMEKSIRDSLSEMMSDHRFSENEDSYPTPKVSSVMDSNTLLETLTDDSSIDSESLRVGNESMIDALEKTKENIEKIKDKIETNIQEDIETQVKKINEDNKIGNKNINQDEDILINNFKDNNNMEVYLKPLEQEVSEMEAITDFMSKDISNVVKIDEKIKQEIQKMDETITESRETINEVKTGLEINENKMDCEKIESNKEDEKVLDDAIRENENKDSQINEENIENTNEFESDVNENKDDEINEENIEDMKKFESNVNENENSEIIEENTEKLKSHVNQETNNQLAENEKDLETSAEETDTLSDKEFKEDSKISIENLKEFPKIPDLNIDQDDESIDSNTDELNEDDKLVIDEEFDEKESDEDNLDVGLKKCTVTNEKQSDANQEKDIEFEENETNKKMENIVEHKEQKHDQLNKRVEETKETDEIVTDDEDADLEENQSVQSEIDYSEKPTEFNEDTIQKQIKDRLIDELGKLNENDSDYERQVKDDEVIEKISEEIKKPIETKIVKKLIEKNENLTKLIEKEKNSDSNIEQNKTNVENQNEIVVTKENKDGEDKEDKRNKLYIICEQKEEENEQELTLIFNENSSTDEINANEGKDENAVIVEVHEDPTTSRESPNYTVALNRNEIVTSPMEEDCLYLECDNQKYLSFKKYLEKLEADPNRSLEDMVESFGGVIVPAVPKAAPIIPAPTISAPTILAATTSVPTISPSTISAPTMSIPTISAPTPSAPTMSAPTISAPTIPASTITAPQKRKLTPSPVEILITNSNNNNDGSGKETTTEEVNEEVKTTVKKRKVGRVKKSNATSTNVSVQQQPQPAQQQMQPQMQQAGIANTENFVMPLSPESDVSANSDKNSGNTLKEEKSRPRSKQRYSSDDLYKPRPLFSSSSRRNRRFNPA